MSFLLIPNEVTSSEAVVWVCVVNENIDPNTLSIKYNGGQRISLNQDWVKYSTKSKRNFLFYQYLTIQNLQPGMEYFFELYSGNQTFSTGSFRTLPNYLPTVNEKPFTILLASCFSSSRAGSNALGTAYLKLREKEKIDLKILCGDQVYLDDPALYFLVNKHSFEDLEEILLANYVKTWTQGGANSPINSINPGYQYFLQNGANFFSSDDHEFWNNAPNRATLIRDSWSVKGRYNWMKIAKSLLEIFQSKHSKIAFDVGSLSFFVADTRVGRDADRMSFMSNADLSALENWVTNLKDVGVLVVGQPIFSDKAGFLKGNLGDWNLPDYAQYEDFVRILSKTEHSIIVLTGDVHFGRISFCQLKPGVFLYELISSPTALVDPKVGGSWKQAPDTFPAFSVPGVSSKPIVNNYDYKFTENHFLLLNFYRDGAKTKAVAKVCEIFAGGKNPIPIKIAEFNLA
jgi:hypothetical protein